MAAPHPSSNGRDADQRGFASLRPADDFGDGVPRAPIQEPPPAFWWALAIAGVLSLSVVWFLFHP